MVDEVMEISLNENQLIVKHNNLIESKFAKLTEREKKLLALVIAQIKKEDEAFNIYKIPAHEIKKALDLDSDRIYEQLKDIATKLKTRAVLVEDVKLKKWAVLSYVETARYEEGYLYIKLHYELAPFLLKLYSHYTPLQLGIILKLNGTHTITIYEWLKKWMKTERKEISLLEFKEKLGVHETKSYDNFKDFRKRILEPAFQEINEKSDITFTYETKKDRLKIVALIFHIKNKENIEVIEAEKQTQILIEEPVYDPVRDKLIEALSPWFHGIQAESIIDEFDCDEKRIMSGVNYLKSEERKGKKISSPGGFIYKAIKNGYGLPSPLEEQKAVEKQRQIEAQKQAEAEEQLRKERDEADNKKAWAEFEAMSGEEQESIIFQLLANNISLREIYRKKGTDSPAVRVEIKQVIKKSWKK